MTIRRCLPAFKFDGRDRKKSPAEQPQTSSNKRVKIKKEKNENDVSTRNVVFVWSLSAELKRLNVCSERLVASLSRAV